MARTPSFPNFWQALLLIGFYWLMMSAPLQVVARMGIPSHPYLTIATVLIGSPLCALLVLWTGYRITREPLSEVFPLGGFSPLPALAVIAATAGVWILIDAGRGNGSMAAIHAGNGKWMLLRYLIPIIYAPFAEELLHRGLILRGFLSRYGKHTAVLLSALLFGLVHGGLGSRNVISAMCFGTVVGYIYAETRSLLPCLLVHSTSNAMFSLAPLVNHSWTQTLWYPALGILLAGGGIGLLLRVRRVPMWSARGHCKKGMTYTKRAEQETAEAAARLLEEACQEYAAAADLVPDSPLTLVNWGVALTRLADGQTGEKQDRLFAEAHNKYSRAVEISAWVQALTNWGGAFLLQARGKTGGEQDWLWKQAYDKFGQAIAIDPRSHATFQLWAKGLADQANAKSGDEADRLIEQAGEKFEAAAAIGADCEATYRNWGHLLLNHAGRRSGEDAIHLWSEAQRRYEAAIEIEPRNVDTRRNCATALWRLAQLENGDHAEAPAKRAQEHCAAALEIEPGSAWTWDTWGIALMVQAEKTGPRAARELRAEARSKFLEAEGIRPGISAYNLACLCALEGEEERCREWLLKAEHGSSMTHERLIADPDLRSVRERPWFREIAAKYELELASAGR